MQTILLVAALVLFILHGLGVRRDRFDPLGWGLACWVASILLPTL